MGKERDLIRTRTRVFLGLSFKRANHRSYGADHQLRNCLGNLVFLEIPTIFIFYFLFVVRSLICLYSVEALYSYDYYVVRLLIMFPLLIRVYDSYTKYTTVKPCKPLLLQQPTRRRQPVP